MLLRCRRLRPPSLPLRSSCRCRFNASLAPPRPSEPLRILFFGSDRFSIASLQALDAARRSKELDVEAIEVVHRPAKPTGRGLKKLKEVEIKNASHTLSLPTHVIDTFTTFTPPPSINLVIAVSFGLLIPARIRSSAKYGGLNVHPSLLPDLRGAAPIEHAILQNRSHTGVSVQTLHPNKFDAGTVLAQSPPPGMVIPPHATAAEVEEELAEEGARMLLEVLKQRLYVPPIEDRGWYKSTGSPVSLAPKLSKSTQQVTFDDHTLQQITNIQRAVGDPWCVLSDTPKLDRIILHEFGPVASDVDVEKKIGEIGGHGTRIWMLEGCEFPVFRAACGTLVEIRKSTVSGGRPGGGNQKLMRVVKEAGRS